MPTFNSGGGVYAFRLNCFGLKCHWRHLRKRNLNKFNLNLDLINAVSLEETSFVLIAFPQTLHNCLFISKYPTWNYFSFAILETEFNELLRKATKVNNLAGVSSVLKGSILPHHYSWSRHWCTSAVHTVSGKRMLSLFHSLE